MTNTPDKICERLRATRIHPSLGRDCEIIERPALINPDGPEAAETIDALYDALKEARKVVAEGRQTLVECSTLAPGHDLATLDPLSREGVDEYDAALAKIDAALTKAEER